MVERLVKSTRSAWGLWALGAALSTACAALLLLRRQRAARELDTYEQWWRRRAEIRANGDQNPHLFV